ncbi:MAG: hypothetical protein GY944_24750 [bacterium]|nr:hypothetical protein [bacterium]
MIGRCVRILLIFAVLSAHGLGCASNTAERDFYDHKQTTTKLRQYLEGDQPIDRGFQHPVVISEERLRRILSSIEVRVDKRFQAEKVIPAISPRVVALVARALSASLEEADSTEEVALISVRKERYLGVFSDRFLTSFVAYVKDDLLTIALSRIDWNLQLLRTSAGGRERLPQPKLGEEVMEFRIVQNPDFAMSGGQAIAVQWQNPRWDVEAAAASPAAAPEAQAETAPPSEQTPAQTREEVPEEATQERPPVETVE